MKELWKPIEGYEGSYEISTLGRVKSLPKPNNGLREIILKPNLVYGYEYIQLSKNNKIKSCRVHRLVAEAFIENPYNKTQVNHKNGIKNDNNAINLEWATPKENTIHAHGNGLTSARGEKHSGAKLTENQVKDIRKLYNDGKYSVSELREKYGVSDGTIRKIVKNKSWKHIL